MPTVIGVSEVLSMLSAQIKHSLHTHMGIHRATYYNDWPIILLLCCRCGTLLPLPLLQKRIHDCRVNPHPTRYLSMSPSNTHATPSTLQMLTIDQLSASARNRRIRTPICLSRLDTAVSRGQPNRECRFWQHKKPNS